MPTGYTGCGGRNVEECRATSNRCHAAQDISQKRSAHRAWLRRTMMFSTRRTWPLLLTGDQQYWRAERVHKYQAALAEELPFASSQRSPDHNKTVAACSCSALDLDLRPRMHHAYAPYRDAAPLAQTPCIHQER